MGPPEKAAYQHGLVCLAEGLAKLGIEFHADRDYWQQSTEEHSFLFKANPDVHPQDCDIVVVESSWIAYQGRLPESIQMRNRRFRSVYIDNADWFPTFSWSEEARGVDVILRSHYNSRLKSPPNVRPWAFGLSNRIIDFTQRAADDPERVRALLLNFRIGHPLRNLMRSRVFEPLADVLPLDTRVDELSFSGLRGVDRLFWEQTGRRHYPNYYRRLRSTLACACVGGFHLPPFCTETASVQHFWRKLTNRLQVSFGPLAQFDSYRFWEAFAAGCVVFHVDLEKYRLALPVMPLNWKHYIGIDVADPKAVRRQIQQRFEELPAFAEAGRTWALDNYSPVPTAVRFLETVLDYK